MKVHNSDMVDGLIDGHLKGWRRWVAKRHISRCTVCALEYRHQLHVSRMLHEVQIPRKMRVAANDFWARVKADIESPAAEPARSRAPAPRLSFGDWLSLRPALIPVTVMAVMVLAVGIFWLQHSATPAPRTNTHTQTPTVVHHAPLPPAVRFAAVEHVETEIPNTVATPFRSKAAGVTVIWVSGLPWTEDMTEMQTLFANLDT